MRAVNLVSLYRCVLENKTSITIIFMTFSVSEWSICRHLLQGTEYCLCRVLYWPLQFTLQSEDSVNNIKEILKRNITFLCFTKYFYTFKTILKQNVCYFFNKKKLSSSTCTECCAMFIPIILCIFLKIMTVKLLFTHVHPTCKSVLCFCHLDQQANKLKHWFN